MSQSPRSSIQKRIGQPRHSIGLGSALPPVIAVVIPAYRAEAHIQAVLAGIPAFVTFIVVVDDCSPGKTAELVKGWDDPRSHLIRHGENQGVGGAVLTGYSFAVDLGAEIVVKMDGDNQMDPAYMLSFIEPIASGEEDYTKGNRFLHARQLRSMPLLRRIGNIGLSFLTKLASGYWNIFDPTNGYTAIHTSLVPMLSRSALDLRYFFESSMLIELSLLRAVVRDVYAPARYGDEVSSLSPRKEILQFPPRLLKGFLRRLLIQYFIRDFTVFSLFLLVGGVFIVFGGTFGAYHWYLSAKSGVEASTGTVMLAVLPIILGIQLLLQAIVSDVQNIPSDPLQNASGLASGPSTNASNPVQQ